ncbi:MAG: hypothetical protein JWM11_4949 [Planctomycetaceae bacterium]|nr:hypothetical protein [Planctomycetaceae bacterium]
MNVNLLPLAAVLRGSSALAVLLANDLRQAHTGMATNAGALFVAQEAGIGRRTSICEPNGTAGQS